MSIAVCVSVHKSGSYIYVDFSSETLICEYMLPLLPKIMKILLHLIEFYATCFVSKRYINLREIV